MHDRWKQTLVSIAVGFSSLLVLSCGGGGGGDGGGGAPPAAQTTQVGGVVVAPSGTLAKAGSPGLFRWFASLIGFPDEVTAQVQGLSPVQNARVFLISVDNAGMPIGVPLAVSTTDANGAFVFNLPAGTNLAPTASTLTVIQAAVSNAPSPVPIGTGGVLNVPAVQSLMLVDPAGELGTRRIIAAGVSKFSASASAGYVGLIQALLDQVPSLVGSSIATTITNIQADPDFQNEVLPVLVDIEQSAQLDQTVVAGTYNLFEYHTYADTPTIPFHRTTEHGDVTFDGVKGTVVVNSSELGGTVKETCVSICTRSFGFQPFTDQTLGREGLFFRTTTNRVIFSAPGSLSFIGQTNPTGSVGIFALNSSEGELSLGILVKQGANISPSDFATTFNFVNFGSSYNRSIISGSASTPGLWPAILDTQSGSGTVTFIATNSPVQVSGFTGTISGMSQNVTCTLSGSGCALIATTVPGGGSSGTVALPFTIQSNGGLVLTDTLGFGAMSSDRALYGAAITDPVRSGFFSLSIVVKQSSAMTNANLTGTYRVITLEENLMSTAQVTTRSVSGTAQFDGVSSSAFTTVAAQVDRTEGCLTGVCNINTTITATSLPVSETRTYGVTPTGILTFSGGSIPAGATVSGGVSPDASFFVVQTQIDNVAGTSTRSIMLGVKVP